MHKEYIHPSRIVPYIIDAIMEFDFPAFRVHGSDTALNGVFAEIERGEDGSEKFHHKLRGQLMAAFNNKLFGVTIFFSNEGPAKYAKAVQITIHPNLFGYCDVAVECPSTERKIRLVVHKDWVDVTKSFGDERTLSFRNGDNALEYFRNFVSENVQLMEDGKVDI